MAFDLLYVSELMTRRLGGGFLKGGTMSVAFVSLCTPAIASRFAAS